MSFRDLAFRRGEAVYYLGTRRTPNGYCPPQEVVILRTFEGSHLPYEIQTVWEDGSKHIHSVEPSRIERG